MVIHNVRVCGEKLRRHTYPGSAATTLQRRLLGWWRAPQPKQSRVDFQTHSCQSATTGNAARLHTPDQRPPEGKVISYLSNAISYQPAFNPLRDEIERQNAYSALFSPVWKAPPNA